MHPSFAITITRRPDFYLVMLPLIIGMELVFGLLFSMIDFGRHGPPGYVRGIATVCGFGLMAAIAIVTGYLPQGVLAISGDHMEAQMLFRRTRVFELSKTTITLEQWFSNVTQGGGGPAGPMLAFTQGDIHFRIGCYDHLVGQLLTRVDGGGFTRIPHGATKCASFYALADMLHVNIPKPPGWRLQEVL